MEKQTTKTMNKWNKLKQSNLTWIIEDGDSLGRGDLYYGTSFHSKLTTAGKGMYWSIIASQFFKFVSRYLQRGNLNLTLSIEVSVRQRKAIYCSFGRIPTHVVDLFYDTGQFTSDNVFWKRIHTRRGRRDRGGCGKTVLLQIFVHFTTLTLWIMKIN